MFVSLVLFNVFVLSGALLFQFRSSFSTLTEVSSQAMTEDLMIQLKKRGEVITRFLAEMLANPLYLYDMEKIYELPNATKQQKDISYAYIFDMTGKILHDGTKNVLKFGKVLDEDATRIGISPKDTVLMKTHDDALEVSLPIWIGDKPLGVGAYIKKPYLLENIGSAIRVELDGD